jgi:uncharacterized protein Usg
MLAVRRSFLHHVCIVVSRWNGGEASAVEPREVRPTMNRDLALQFEGYRLTTAEILYHMPDHPTLLQTFVWQALDLAPRFPVLHGFLAFWEKNLDGRLHSVRVAQAQLIRADRVRHAEALLHIH